MQFKQAYDLVLEEIVRWYNAGITAVPRLVVAVFILIAFYFLSRLIRKILWRIFTRITSNNESIVRLVAKSGQFIVNAIAIFTALSVLELNKTVTSLLAGAGVVGLAVGFAFKETLSDYLSGMLIAVRQPYVIGEIISTNDHFAKVTSLNLRATELETFSGQVIIIPNAEIFNKPIINYSRLGRRRIEIKVGVTYSADLPRVQQVTTAAIKGLDFVLADPPMQFLYTQFGESSVDFEMRFWVKYPGATDYLEARSMAISTIRQAFKDHDIVIPFPIRTLDLPENLLESFEK